MKFKSLSKTVSTKRCWQRKIFFKSESLASDMIDNVPENCGICCGNRMKKKNFSVVDAAGDSFKSLLLFRLVFRVPVRISKTPENCFIS